ncbi:hypothetical protein M427DRAFT_45369 [Gonapodya prolifera JEL478]|uniref:Vacuolar sorting protein 39/Transforming growth factor beta receptor-associated domain-containing protein n=1 Tax=Gonapodya prolifera (strain JEL478) TaxID=1344416 RepID=A0A139AAY6_GONPJ|nr:hypothetical protein M427DRAFT_45369 [Gonapodya prolifera JEL478]|eukprot:KXS13868.1 hypothetical protein M427DRAFT_45369 [Gonapodya prolifera JEL478]
MYSTRKVPAPETKADAMKGREADTGPDAPGIVQQGTDDGNSWMQPKALLKPPNQVQLTDKELDEEFTRVLNANNPLAAQNYARFNNKDRIFRVAQNVEHTVLHFEFDGYLVYKEDPIGSGLSSASESSTTDTANPAGATSAEGSAVTPDSKTRPVESKEEESETKMKKPARNQFSFAERASQTPSNPLRDRFTNTDPPPQRTISHNVSQWTIFDAYMEDLAAKERAKEKGKVSIVPDEKSLLPTTAALQAAPSAPTKTTTHSSDLPPLPASMTSTTGVGEAANEHFHRNPDLRRNLAVVERMANQNTFDDVAQDFRYWDDAADEGREGRRGTLLPLWKFAHDPHRKKQVTSVSWSPKFSDMLAVGYGSYDFVKQGPGEVAVFSFKNPSYPEWLWEADSGVMCLDFHPQHPSLLAVGLYDGTVLVYDLQDKSAAPLLRSQGRAGKHSDPVWQVRWQRDDLDDNANFCSISSDGRVTGWTVLKNELAYTDIIRIVNQPEGGATHAGDVPEEESKFMDAGGGCCLDFSKTDEHLFVVGTEEGKLHLCSKAYSSEYLRTYEDTKIQHWPVCFCEGHHMAIYAVRMNPFHSNYFITASGDWTVKLWDISQTSPVMTFDLGGPVGDVAWAPFASTIFAAGTTEGKVFVFDLNVNKYEAICEQQVARKAKVTHVVFNGFSPVLLVGDDRGAVTSLKLSPTLVSVPAEITCVAVGEWNEDRSRRGYESGRERNPSEENQDVKLYVGTAKGLLATYSVSLPRPGSADGFTKELNQRPFPSRSPEEPALLNPLAAIAKKHVTRAPVVALLNTKKRFTSDSKPIIQLEELKHLRVLISLTAMGKSVGVFEVGESGEFDLVKVKHGARTSTENPGLRSHPTLWLVNANYFDYPLNGTVTCSTIGRTQQETAEYAVVDAGEDVGGVEIYALGKDVLETGTGRKSAWSIGEASGVTVGITLEGTTIIVHSTEPSKVEAKVQWSAPPGSVATKLIVAHLRSAEEIQNIPLIAGDYHPPAQIASRASLSTLQVGQFSGSHDSPGHHSATSSRRHSRTPSVTSSIAPTAAAAAARSRAGSVASAKSRAGSLMGQPALPSRMGIFKAAGKIWVFCGGKVGILEEIGWAERVRRLVLDGNFESAIEYVEVAEGVPDDAKTSLPSRLRLLRAHHMFSVVRDYTTAMTLFQDLDVDPRQVCGLFPAVRTWGESEPSIPPFPEDDAPYPHRPREPPPQAYAALVRFLTERRMRTLRSRQDLIRSRASSEFEVQKEISRLERVAVVVDTCLLSVYLAAKSSLVRPLMRVENWVDVSVASEWLEHDRRYDELLDLFFGKGMHDRALQFLERLGRDPASRLAGPSALVTYLKRLGERDLDLVLKASTWALETAPEEGLEHLADLSDDLATAYLEHLIYDLGDQTPELHEDLVAEYLADVPAAEAAIVGKELSKSSPRMRLREFLEYSKVYHPEHVIWRFPVDGMYEERAIMLSRMGLHEQALDIFVNKLGNRSLAETLVYHCVSAVLIPDLLPASVAVGLLSSYFDKSFHELTRSKRDGQVIRNLSMTERAQVKETLINLQKRRLQMTRVRNCSRCFKRIGTSAFVLYKEQLFHYACMGIKTEDVGR